MYWGLLGALDRRRRRRRASPRNLRVAVSGGAALPVEIIKRFEERFGVQILEGYGLSETSPVATFSRPRARPAARLDRRPDLGRRVKLIDEDWNDRRRRRTRSARSPSAATTS